MYNIPVLSWIVSLYWVDTAKRVADERAAAEAKRLADDKLHEPRQRQDPQPKQEKKQENGRYPLIAGVFMPVLFFCLKEIASYFAKKGLTLLDRELQQQIKSPDPSSDSDDSAWVWIVCSFAIICIFMQTICEYLCSGRAKKWSSLFRVPTTSHIKVPFHCIAAIGREARRLLTRPLILIKRTSTIQNLVQYHFDDDLDCIILHLKGN